MAVVRNLVPICLVTFIAVGVIFRDSLSLINCDPKIVTEIREIPVLISPPSDHPVLNLSHIRLEAVRRRNEHIFRSCSPQSNYISGQGVQTLDKVKLLDKPYAVVSVLAPNWDQMVQQQRGLRECPVPCYVTRGPHKSERICREEANGVVFFGHIMHKGSPAGDSWSINPFPKGRYQKWIYEVSECNRRYRDEQGELFQNIDINMTYHQSSQVPFLYVPDNLHDMYRPPYPKRTDGGMIAAVISNAGGHSYTQERLRILSELDKAMPGRVHSFGGAMHNREIPEEVELAAARIPWPERGVWTCVPAEGYNNLRIKGVLVRSYKFVYAHESSEDEDYVTEKVYQPLFAGSVPLYRGAKNINEFVPPNSIINIDDFNSTEELANYLLYLDGNDTAYNEYFAWKHAPLPEKLWQLSQNTGWTVACRLCQALQGVVEQEIDDLVQAEVRKVYEAHAQGPEHSLLEAPSEPPPA
eukprot:TRINITY_DN31627_c0_g1_i1.p1 TRINITY_DN31627_c0_g1~~TRINITY_DN31627_c0_g1_i1.p1  ORF type:complete len:469 (-),score=94.13 TRINITY_DN31627_c0_g1_i1:202-1608(-)